jgi:hypothetical protein
MSSGNVLAGVVFESGNSLIEYCRDTSKVGKAYCYGYIAGVADAMEGDPLLGWRTCLPDGVTVGQIGDVVKAWLGSHPEDRHFVADELVDEALAEAFPCKE